MPHNVRLTQARVRFLAWDMRSCQKPNQVTVRQNMFIKSHQEPILAQFTGSWNQLEAAVTEAETAVRERLQSHSELTSHNAVNAAKKRRMSVEALVKERKLKFCAATVREQAAFEPLCQAIEAMHTTLAEVRAFRAAEKKMDSLSAFWMRDALNLNFSLAVELYKRAFTALSRFGYADLEWTLSTMLDQDREEAELWLDGVPELPERKALSSLDRDPKSSAIMMASVFTMLERFESGGGCVSINDRESAAYLVARLLKAKGWNAFVQDRTSPGMSVGLQVNKPRKKRS